MNREMIIGILIGLIAGWLIEWVIDWLYWRKRCADNAKFLADGKDNLQKIKGIGPEIEKRLNKAGIYTFAQLSELKQSDVENLVGSTQNLADEQALIDEAKKRAKKKAKKKDKKGK